MLLAVCFSLKCTLSALPLQTYFVEEVGENAMMVS